MAKNIANQIATLEAQADRVKESIARRMVVVNDQQAMVARIEQQIAKLKEENPPQD